MLYLFHKYIQYYLVFKNQLPTEFLVHVAVWNLNISLGTCLLCTTGFLTLLPNYYSVFICVCVCVYIYIQGVTGGTDQTSGECSLGQIIPI